MDKNQDLDRPAENFFGFTKVDVIKISYEWKIHDFRVIGQNNRVSLKSSEFSSNYANVKWCISLYPKGRNEDSEDFLSIFLRSESHPENLQLETNFQISILNRNRKKCFVKDHTHTFIKSSGHGATKHVLKSEIMNDDYLPNGCLTIVCDITAGLDKIMTKNCTAFDNIKADEKSQHVLLNDYESLLNNQKLCDVTIVISDKKLHAHKAILAAHSPVFMNMFVNDTIENRESILQITDIEFKVFQELLRFIYSGKIESMDIVVNDLLVAADKYSIGGLLRKCEEYLQNIFNVDNIINILLLADNNNAESLRISAIKYFIANRKDIIGVNSLDFLERLKPCTVKEMLKFAIY